MSISISISLPLPYLNMVIGVGLLVDGEVVGGSCRKERQGEGDE